MRIVCNSSKSIGLKFFGLARLNRGMNRIPDLGLSGCSPLLKSVKFAQEVGVAKGIVKVGLIACLYFVDGDLR